MKVIFLGVGEAFDERVGNNAHIVLSETKLLLDCGYAIPRLFWTHFPDPDFLDAVYISHAHADHYMGLPLVLGRMAEDERTRPLKIVSQPSVIKMLPSLINYAYRRLLKELPFPVEFLRASKGEELKLGGLSLNFASSKHVVSNYGVRVEAEGNSVCYSGDGAFTDATKELYRGADLVIHETYTLEPEMQVHANVRDVMAMCDEVGVKRLALTHLRRDVRKDMGEVMRFIESHAGRVRVLVPEPLEEFAFS